LKPATRSEFLIDPFGQHALTRSIAGGRLSPEQTAGIFTIRLSSIPKSRRVTRCHQTTGSGQMLDPTQKSLDRLDIQPGCLLMPGADHHATGYGQIEPAVAAVPSPTGTRPPASLPDAGAGIVRRLFDAVGNLRMRSREHRMPLELDDHVLRDIGLTRAEYCFLRMSRATTAPDRSQKPQESSRSGARLF
jgi:uncharacterized protein YjiS (DUF1127 family)